MPPSKTTEISLPTSSTLVAGIAIPLQIPLKTVRTNSVIHKDPNTSEKFACQDNSFGATSHNVISQLLQLYFSQNSIKLTGIHQCIHITILLNQIRSNPTLADQSNLSNDHTFMLNTKTCTYFVRTSLGSSKDCFYLLIE